METLTLACALVCIEMVIPIHKIYEIWQGSGVQLELDQCKWVMRVMCLLRFPITRYAIVVAMADTLFIRCWAYLV